MLKIISMIDEREPSPEIPVFSVSTGLITINGQQAQPFNGIYFIEPGASISITIQLMDEQGQRPAVSVPAVLKMPLVRHANGQPTDDEVYLSCTLNQGTLNVYGRIPRSGDWKVLVERQNKALNVINAGFNLDAEDLTFIA